MAFREETLLNLQVARGPGRGAAMRKADGLALAHQAIPAFYLQSCHC